MDWDSFERSATLLHGIRRDLVAAVIMAQQSRDRETTFQEDAEFAVEAADALIEELDRTSTHEREPERIKVKPITTAAKRPKRA